MKVRVRVRVGVRVRVKVRVRVRVPVRVRVRVKVRPLVRKRSTIVDADAIARKHEQSLAIDDSTSWRAGPQFVVELRGGADLARAARV